MTTNATAPTDVLLQSRQAKSYFFERCSLLSLDPFVVAANAGVTKERFTKWVNALSDEELVTTVTGREVMTMFESIGIFPRINFIVVPLDDLDEKQKRLINEMKLKKL